MSACQKNSGVSPKLIAIIEDKVKKIGGILGGPSKIVILNASDEILYCNSDLISDTQDGRTTKEDLQDQITNVKESCNRFSTGCQYFTDHKSNGIIHVQGKKSLFSVYQGEKITLAFFTEMRDVQFNSDNDKEMEPIIHDIILLLANVMKQKKTVDKTH
ncbi:hypothetical protein AKO1_011181 [Acrasis kona]|uniref:Uncharacterized protein n=1 Tax=Acrasis kona TaxID=1008807 RepID=A0AAW2Z126_9EUKA